MIKTAVFCRSLSDTYLRQITQLGVDCVDFGQIDVFPGYEELGYPDLERVMKIKRKVSSWGLEVNRVTLPNISAAFMRGEPGTEHELEDTYAEIEGASESGPREGGR